MSAKVESRIMPSDSQLEGELSRERYKGRFHRVLRSTVFTLVVIAAVAVLLSTLLFPVLQIYGSSMSPTLTEGDIVVAVKGSGFSQGDLVAFYYGNKLLIKRCIAVPGDWVSIDETGNVFVNGVQLWEPYVSEKALGECDLEFPYQVPEDRWFLMGDHRETSVDSRSSVIGCVADEQIVGRIVFRVWPFAELGTLG